MDVQLSVRCDAQQPVESARSGGVECLTDRDAGDLRATALSAARSPGLPAELLRPDVERLTLIGAGDRTLTGTVAGIVIGCVDPADGYEIETQLAGGLVDDRLDSRRELVLPRPPLGTRGRRVGEHRKPSEAHGGRRVDD